MRKSHHTDFYINYKGEVSYKFWNENGEYADWHTATTPEQCNTQMKNLQKALDRCVEIQKSISHLDWSDM